MQDAPTYASDEYLTVTQAADLLGVSRRTVERYMEEKHLTVLRLPANNRPRLKRTEVESLAVPTVPKDAA